MRKKKLYTMWIYALLFLVAIVVYWILSSNSKGKEVYVEAKTEEFTTLDEIENAADIVVYGEKISEDEPTIFRNENDAVITIYTLSEIRINEIVRGNVENDEIITILENEGYDKMTNTTYHIAGYKKMEVGKSYLLILIKANNNPWFIPVGINYGKIPEDESEDLQYYDREHSQSGEDLLNIVERVREVYEF